MDVRLLPPTWPLGLVLTLLMGAGAPLAAQDEPVLETVTITAPTGTLREPFRTNRELISIEFDSDVSGGVFFATSEGAGIPMTNILPEGGGGRVGAGLDTEGRLAIRVRVTLGDGASPPLSAVSEPVFVILDRTPPNLSISTIRLGPDRPRLPFDPSTTYRTNADSIELRGFVDDGPDGVPRESITISVTGIAGDQTVSPEPSGLFTIEIDISDQPDGPLPLGLVANDNVAGPRDGNRVDVPVSLR